MLGLDNEFLIISSPDDEVWDIIAYYLGQACNNILLLACPEKIVIGGGMINNEGLMDKVRNQFKQILNNYVQHPRLQSSFSYGFFHIYFRSRRIYSFLEISPEQWLNFCNCYG